MPETTRALSIRRFAAMLFRAAPRATLVSIVLMVLVALTEGIGIFLLVPLLALAGVTTGTALPQSGTLGRLTAHLPHSLGLLLLVYVVVVGFRAALEFAETVASVTVQTEVTRSLRERLYRALIGARWETVAPLRGARLAHVFTTELERVSLTTHEMLSGALQLLIALIYAGAAVAISPALALVALGRIPDGRARGLGEGLRRMPAACVDIARWQAHRIVLSVDRHRSSLLRRNPV